MIEAEIIGTAPGFNDPLECTRFMDALSGDEFKLTDAI